MKKALLIGCPLALLLGVGGIVGFVYLVFWATSGPVDATDQLLTLTAEGKYHEAYESCSQTLKDQQDEASFTKAVQYFGLDEYESSSWHSRVINNNQGSLEGTITTKTGGTIPVSVKLIKEQDTWKVVTLTVPDAGLQDATTLDVPADEQLHELTLQSLLDFNQALQAEDFTEFFETISTVWQLQTTSAELKEAFQPLIDESIDLADIAQVEPVFTQAPTIDADGLLVLEGHYPTQPLQFAFTLKYTYEQSQWKLFGIHVLAQDVQ